MNMYIYSLYPGYGAATVCIVAKNEQEAAGFLDELRGMHSGWFLNEPGLDAVVPVRRGQQAGIIYQYGYEE